MSRGRHIAPKTRSGRVSWGVLGLVMGLFLAMAIPAGANNKTTVSWTVDDKPAVMTADYMENPNGLVHQWRHPGSEAGNGATHLVFQPVGDKWPAADCDTDDPDFITSIGPWLYNASRYDYQSGPAAPLANGAYYWVCFYR